MCIFFLKQKRTVLQLKMSGVGAQGFTHGDHATNQQSRANALEDKMQGLIQQPTLQLPNESEAGKMANFPAKLIPKDPYDNVYAVKANQLNKDTNMYGRTPQITMELTQRDIDYIENKRKVQNKINYEAWLTTAIDLGDPTQGKSSTSYRKRGVGGGLASKMKKIKKTTKQKKLTKKHLTTHSGSRKRQGRS
jgi:hypothetical protein